MQRSLIALMLALGLVFSVSPMASAQQTTTRTGPNGRTQTTTRTAADGQQTTTRTGSNGRTQTTTRTFDR